MPTSVKVIVTPRLEIFYALQALTGNPAPALSQWRADADEQLPGRLRRKLARLAPVPLLWPLLADAFRDAPATAGFDELTKFLRNMDDRSFQAAVLGGVFKGRSSVRKLVAGESTLADTVADESRARAGLMSLLGLHPFSSKAPAAVAIARLLEEPGSCRIELADALESFRETVFGETWESFEPAMNDWATRTRHEIEEQSFAQFAERNKLPVTTVDGALVTRPGATIAAADREAVVHLMPSAFNVARMWTSYAGPRGSARVFIPVLVPGLMRESAAAAIEPALIFRALGDTTRYAVAEMIARNPMTSAALARAFKVSRPTMSHHVSLLRDSGLLEETSTEAGVLLKLDRRALETASARAASRMFAEGGEQPGIRRSRRARRQTRE